MRLPAWLRARLGGWDLVVLLFGAVLLVLFAALTDDDLAAGVEPRSFDWLAVVILVATGIILLFRHRYPLTVVIVVLGLIGWWNSIGYTNGLINFAALVAYFSVGVTGDRRKQVAAIVLTVVPVVGVVVLGGAPARSIVDGVGWPVAAMLFGELSRSRRVLMERYQRRAERAEADRETEARRRVAEERLRIARDLHDLLGHTVSVMMVQAGVAADKFDGAPDRARAAVGHIRAAGREANKEIRATIELLRHGDELALAPTPAIPDITRLVANAKSLGLDVACEIPADAVHVDALVGLTAYRIVQEALTNVLKHSTAEHVAISIERDNGVLSCAVRDDGRAARPGGVAGNGLAGMTERVTLAGGRLRYGPRPDGGFEVVAALPTSGGAT